MIIKAKADDNLNEILNTKVEGKLQVELPSGCIYRQKVKVERSDLLVIGNGAKIVWDDHNGMVPGFGTGASATLTIAADHVEFRDTVIENDFDYLGHEAKAGEDPKVMMGRQAVAVFTRPESTDSVFKNCTFISWQDTLFADGAENRFEHCTIKGNIDFIFGRSHAVFDRCTIISTGSGFVAAPSTSENTEQGLCFERCTITCTDDVRDASVYLARPWHPSERDDTNSCVSFSDCTLDRHINSALWTTMWDKKGHNHLPSENRFHIDDKTLKTRRNAMEKILKEIDLQDCPLCGGPAVLEEEGSWCFYVMCMDCGCHTAEIPYSSPEERLTSAKNAAHLWNIGKVLRSDPGE